MRRVILVAAMVAVSSQAWAGSPFNNVTEAQKRKIVVPEIRALTNCVASITLADPDGAVQYRAGLLRAYVSRQLQKCPQEMNRLLDLYESTYGDGEAERFIKGPYLTDLPRAVLSVIRPQLDTKVDAAKQQEEAARQQAADARMQAEIESAARANAAAADMAEKQRFIDKALLASDPPISPSDARSVPEAGVKPVPAPSNGSATVPQGSVQQDLADYASAHGMSVRDVVQRTGLSALDLNDYIEGGKRSGQTAESVITRLLATKVVALDQNTSTVASLGVSDMPFIVDTYKKNEMRFVRDFKGKHFDSDVKFANARQNIIVSGSYTVSFGKGDFGGNLTCETSDPKQIGIIADWDKGDAVHVSGDIRDVTFGDLQLSDCLMQRK